jgi:chromosome segregation ATPase
MPRKWQSDDHDLMEIFQQHYVELRREHSEYEETVQKLEHEVAGLRGRIDQLEELNKLLTEERDQFLERYYRLVTQFELIGGGVDRVRAGVSDTIGLLRRRPETHEPPRELPSLPPAKSLNNSNGQLEDGIAKIAAKLGDEHRSSVE